MKFPESDNMVWIYEIQFIDFLWDSQYVIDDIWNLILDVKDDIVGRENNCVKIKWHANQLQRAKRLKSHERVYNQ